MNAPCGKILLVDDEQSILLTSGTLLRSAGIRDLLTLDDARKVLPLLERERVDVIVLDLFMPFVSGKELLAEIAQEYPQIPLLVMTAADELETAVECMKGGAFDYLVKPVERSRFISSVTKALEICSLRKQMDDLRDHLLHGRLEQPSVFSAIITASEKMTTIFQYAEVVARSSEPMLITGETGVGKELVARAVHDASGLKGSFVPVNVAALDDALFSDTLFGHRKGAFTGASMPREGMIAQASGGTLLLDEIGDLGQPSQVKLLRLLQEREYYPVGSDIPRKNNARIIAVTNRSLRDMVAAGAFRKDLYYRLCTHHVEIPPLRERREDLPLLLDHFLEKGSLALGVKKPAIPPQALPLLATYPFPGNVRELEAMVCDAIARHRSGVLSLDSFRRCMREGQAMGTQPSAEAAASRRALWDQFPALPSLREAESFLIREALKRSEGNQGIAAALLGISRTALNKRLKRKLGLVP